MHNFSFLKLRVVVLTFLVGLFAAPAFGAETVTLNIGTLASNETAMVKALTHWSAQMRDLTENRVVIRILSDGVVGDESQITAALHSGKLDGAVLSAFSLATIEQDVLAACLPSEFTATSNYFMFLQFFRDELRDAFAQKGFFLAEMTLGGENYLMSKQKINSPSAFSKEKFAVRNAVEATYWEHFGLKTSVQKPATFLADLEKGTFSSFMGSPMMVKQLDTGTLPRSKQAFSLEPWGLLFRDAAWQKVSEGDRKILMKGLGTLLYGGSQKAMSEKNQFMLPGFAARQSFGIDDKDWKQFFADGKSTVLKEMISEKLQNRLSEMSWD